MRNYQPFCFYYVSTRRFSLVLAFVDGGEVSFKIRTAGDSERGHPGARLESAGINKKNARGRNVGRMKEDT